MARYSMRHQDRWEVSLYLIVNDRGDVRMSRGYPSLAGCERALSLTLTVPHSLFKVPQFSATIILGEAAQAEVPIDIEAAETALTKALGARVEIQIKENPDG